MKARGFLALLAIFNVCAGDHMENIERPCPKCDMDCVGRVFSQELVCSPVRRKISDSFTIKYLPLSYPSSNTSTFYSHSVAKGMSDFTVNEFYINRKTKTLVLEVVFKQIEIHSPNTKGYFYKKGKEAIVTTGYTYTIYKNYSLTLTVSNVDGRRTHDLNDYKVFTYVSDADPPIGNDESFEPKDPEAARELQICYDKLGLSMQEETVNQGPVFMSHILPCNLKLSKF